MTRTHRLTQAILLAATGAACRSEPSPPPTTATTTTATTTATTTTTTTATAATAATTTTTDGGQAQSPSPVASAAPTTTAPIAERDGKPPPGATALCADAMSCVAGSWCAYLTAGARRGFFGQPSTICICDGSGKFVCPTNARTISEPNRQVCIARTGATCPAIADKTTQRLLDARFQTDGCPRFMPGKEATVVNDGAGRPQCCYTGSFGLCEGRPLFVGAQQRHALLLPRSWG